MFSLAQAKKLLTKAQTKLIVLTLVTYSEFAAAFDSTHQDDFNALYEQLLGWASGSLGKSIALLFLLIGLCLGLSRGSIYAAVVSIAAGLSLVLAPSIINSIFMNTP